MSDFKVGDKVVCIDKGNNSDLTLGKIYGVVEDFRSYNRVIIIDDTGSSYWYSPERFRLATLLERELNE